MTREKRLAYQREWYQKNKDRILAQQRAKPRDPEKQREYQRRWFEKNRDKERVRARVKNWRVYGCSGPTRPEPAECECCGRRNADGRALSLDHCHETGAFRGWLCSRCNLGIGKLGDSIESVQRALDYLKRSAQ